MQFSLLLYVYCDKRNFKTICINIQILYTILKSVKIEKQIPTFFRFTRIIFYMKHCMFMF
jgi:hypothetical protein